MWRRSTPTRGSFWLEASGYSLACGSIGEFASLTLEERERVLEETIRAVDGRAMVLGHASATDRSSILRLAQHAARVGAAGVMVLLPYYYRLSDSEILDFFRWLDASIELPFLVYNNPGTTGMNISLQAVGALSELPWFAGLKEASPDVVRFHQVYRRFGDRFPVIAATETPVAFFLLSGSPTVMTAAVDYAPEFMQDLLNAASAGDVPRSGSCTIICSRFAGRWSRFCNRATRPMFRSRRPGWKRGG